jgi:hypothetical protein
MGFLKIFKPVHHCIEFGVGDFRRVHHIVEIIVAIELPAQFVDFLLFH